MTPSGIEPTTFRFVAQHPLISAEQIRTHIVGNSIEGLGRDIDRKYKRLPKWLGLSVVPLTTYLGQLGYTGLHLGNLRSGWNL